MFDSLKQQQALFVDPAEADKVFAAADALGVKCTGVLTTHHHIDHAGGNESVLKRVKVCFGFVCFFMFLILFSSLNKQVPVYGGDDSVNSLSHKVTSKDSISLGALTVRVLETPCHTAGHVCYFVEAGGRRAVFTGDTLFLAGCGRFFEGTAAQMHNSLNTVLASLPDDTLVYCGHEYTEVRERERERKSCFGLQMLIFIVCFSRI